MTKKYFKDHVLMAIELDTECGRYWKTMKGSEVQNYLDNLRNEGLSDIDYSSQQDDPEIREILDKAETIYRDREARKGFKSLDDVIDSLLTDEEPKQKRIWTEEEIKDLIQKNDKVLYGALQKLYAEQTADEQRVGETTHQNGVGFNGVDAPIMSSFVEFLKRTGFLTDKQKAVARKKLVKYNKQLTKLANA